MRLGAQLHARPTLVSTGAPGTGQYIRGALPYALCSTVNVPCVRVLHGSGRDDVANRAATMPFQVFGDMHTGIPEFVRNPAWGAPWIKAMGCIYVYLSVADEDIDACRYCPAQACKLKLCTSCALGRLDVRPRIMYVGQTLQWLARRHDEHLRNDDTAFDAQCDDTLVLRCILVLTAEARVGNKEQAWALERGLQSRLDAEESRLIAELHPCLNTRLSS